MSSFPPRSRKKVSQIKEHVRSPSPPTESPDKSPKGRLSPHPQATRRKPRNTRTEQTVISQEQEAPPPPPDELASKHASHRSTSAPAKAYLLRLPPEIRIIIFSTLLQDINMISITRTNKGSVHRTHGAQAILFVNRQLREEAKPVFFRNCIFHIPHYELHSRFHRQNPYLSRCNIYNLNINWDPPPSTRYRSIGLEPKFVLKIKSLKKAVIDCKAVNYWRISHNDQTLINDLEIQILEKFHQNQKQLPKWVRTLVNAERCFSLHLILYFTRGQYDPVALSKDQATLIAAKIDVDKTKLIGLRYYPMRSWVRKWTGVNKSKDEYRNVNDDVVESRWRDLPCVVEKGLYPE